MGLPMQEGSRPGSPLDYPEISQRAQMVSFMLDLPIAGTPVNEGDVGHNA